MSIQGRHTTLILAISARLHTGALTVGGVVSTACRSREALGRGKTSALDSERLAHDRAAASERLEVGDGSTTRTGTSSRRERAQRRGRGAFEERTHRAGLIEKSLHDGRRELLCQKYAVNGF